MNDKIPVYKGVLSLLLFKIHKNSGIIYMYLRESFKKGMQNAPTVFSLKN